MATVRRLDVANPEELVKKLNLFFVKDPGLGVPNRRTEGVRLSIPELMNSQNRYCCNISRLA
eukprot:2855630-Amphidinium_carterae.1